MWMYWLCLSLWETPRVFENAAFSSLTMPLAKPYSQYLVLIINAGIYEMSIEIFYVNFFLSIMIKNANFLEINYLEK